MFRDYTDRNALQIPQGLERRTRNEIPDTPLKSGCLRLVEYVAGRVDNTRPIVIHFYSLGRCEGLADWWPDSAGFDEC